MQKKSWFERVLDSRDQKAHALATQNLAPGEELLCVRMGTFDDIAPFNKKPSYTSGAMVVTPIRVLRISNPFKNVRSIPLEQISAVNQSVAGGGMFAKIEVVSPGDSLDIQCNPENAATLVAAIESARAAVAAPPEPASESDPLAQIEKLATLRDKGVLSEEEFIAKKAELLKKI